MVVSLLGLWLLSGSASPGQATKPADTKEPAAKRNLSEVVSNLPAYSSGDSEVIFSEALENATDAERDAALPGLIRWLADERPQVRAMAMLATGFLYTPNQASREFTCTRYLPEVDVPLVAEHLKDSNSGVRNATFLALGSTERCGHGLDVLVNLVMQMLREPDILTEYPDPFFVESEARSLAGMTPQQQAEFRAHPRPVFKLPAEGPLLLSILAGTMRAESAVDDAMIAFLDRGDQTRSTLGECMHTLALSHASERVNDEVLRRVFEQKAMTVFLLQFITWLRLTPEQLSEQKKRLIALSNDQSARPEVREAAAGVAECWNGTSKGQCRPLLEYLNRENNKSFEP